MTEALINGIRIRYEAAGRWPARAAHPRLLRHRPQAPQAKALSDSYTIISWDMRGHGETESPLSSSDGLASRPSLRQRSG